jgi:hypothetical protein
MDGFRNLTHTRVRVRLRSIGPVNLPSQLHGLRLVQGFSVKGPTNIHGGQWR